MDIFSICGVMVVAVILSTLLGQYKPEYKILISIITIIIVFYICATTLQPIKDIIEDIFSKTGSSFELLKVLYKTLAITYITGLTSDVCLDAGEKALASNTQLAGKIAIIYVSLPLIEETIKIIGSLTSL